jgi:hypothetical protein
VIWILQFNFQSGAACPKARKVIGSTDDPRLLLGNSWLLRNAAGTKKLALECKL